MNDSNSAFPAWLAALVAVVVGLVLGVAGTLLLDPATAHIQALEIENASLKENQSVLDSALKQAKAALIANTKHGQLVNGKLRQIGEKLEDNNAKNKAAYETLLAERDELARQVEAQELGEHDREEVRIAKSFESTVPWIFPEWQVRVTENDGEYQTHSWQVTVANQGQESVTPSIYLQWVDQEGFVIEETLVDNSREILPGQTETFRNTKILNRHAVEQYFEVTCKIEE